MLEFSRHHQEAQLASKQKQSLRQLTEDEVKLDDHLQQLYRLDRVVQEHSFNVTSLQEDQVVPMCFRYCGWLWPPYVIGDHYIFAL